uniref:No apical meristem-associated C-terminal domain-containing protein n=1 Tax=Oryza glaberrima TaxID=4538 RepID=I1QN77_ORYGL
MLPHSDSSRPRPPSAHPSAARLPASRPPRLEKGNFALPPPFGFPPPPPPGSTFVPPPQSGVPPPPPLGSFFVPPPQSRVPPPPPQPGVPPLPQFGMMPQYGLNQSTAPLRPTATASSWLGFAPHRSAQLHPQSSKRPIENEEGTDPVDNDYAGVDLRQDWSAGEEEVDRRCSFGVPLTYFVSNEGSMDGSGYFTNLINEGGRSYDWSAEGSHPEYLSNNSRKEKLLRTLQIALKFGSCIIGPLYKSVSINKLAGCVSYIENRPQSGVNAEDKNCVSQVKEDPIAADGVQPSGRPAGRKKEKEKQRQHSDQSKIDALDLLWNKKKEVDAEKDRQREERYRAALALEQKRIDLDKEKLDFKRMIQEDRIVRL